MVKGVLVCLGPPVSQVLGKRQFCLHCIRLVDILLFFDRLFVLFGLHFPFFGLESLCVCDFGRAWIS